MSEAMITRRGGGGFGGLEWVSSTQANANQTLYVNIPDKGRFFLYSSIYSSDGLVTVEIDNYQIISAFSYYETKHVDDISGYVSISGTQLVSNYTSVYGYQIGRLFRVV